MRRRSRSVPKYRKHKASGQAVVTLDGMDFYLGPYNPRARVPCNGRADFVSKIVLATYFGSSWISLAVNRCQLFGWKDGAAVHFGPGRRSIRVSLPVGVAAKSVPVGLANLSTNPGRTSIQGYSSGFTRVSKTRPGGTRLAGTPCQLVLTDAVRQPSRSSATRSRRLLRCELPPNRRGFLLSERVK